MYHIVSYANMMLYALSNYIKPICPQQWVNH